MTDRRWYEVTVGTDEKPTGLVQVLAENADQAIDLAREMLADVGVLPGRMHEVWVSLCEATA